MEIRVGDLKKLMVVLAKEDAHKIGIESVDGANPRICFDFKDRSGGDCRVEIFRADIGSTPDITRTRKLYEKEEK